MRKHVCGTLIVLMSLISYANGQTNTSKNYQDLQSKIAKGWNTWSYGSMLTHVLLPEALTMKVNFRLAINGTPYDPNYFMEDIIVDKSGMVRPIAHTFDGSYTELIIDGWKKNSIKIQSTAKGDDIIILVTPIKNSPSELYQVELHTGIMWNMPGSIQRSGDSIVARMINKQYVIHSTRKNIEASHPYISPYLVFTGDSSVAFYTGTKKTLQEAKAKIESAKKAYDDYALKYNELAEAFKGIQSVLAWNTIYDADKNRIISPVTRGWNEAYKGYVLFEWDTYFAALLFALDNKDFAYSNAIAVTRGEDPSHVGFTQFPGVEHPNSQPPVGSMICWMIYEKYQEKWFLEEVYNELLAWNRWWMDNRINNGYLTWGAQWKGASAQEGMWESGLDNSPMYEDVKMVEVRGKSLMNLADVGLNSLYVADCRNLAKMAKVLGKTADEKEIVAREKKFTELVKGMWDEKTGIYLNKYLDRKELSYRLSPTLFYPMISGIATPKQFQRIMKEHYYNTNEFYGNYIIPSCARNDKNYNNDYWRGAIWGPMNFLVYIGLSNYDKKAAAELANKSYDLYIKAWNEQHYVFENINSAKGISTTDQQLNSDPYYHWGALMGLMKFIEAGKFTNTNNNTDSKIKK